MSEVAGIKHQIVFNKEEKSATVTTCNNGKITKVTIFANSNNNNVFDAEDKISITTTDSNGQSISEHKTDAGLIARLLSAIKGQTIEQASEVKNVQASGELFDPSSLESNGITREIKSVGSLFNAAQKAGRDYSSTPIGGSPQTGGSGNVPQTNSPEDARLAELRTRYAEIQRKKMILQNLANLVSQSQVALGAISNPLMSLPSQIYAANGFGIAALLSNPQLPAIQAFERSAGISIQEAINQLKAEEAAIKSELAQLGKTEQDLINCTSFGRLRQRTPGHVENPTQPDTTTPTSSPEGAPSAEPETVGVSVEGTSPANNDRDEAEENNDLDEFNKFKNNLSDEEKRRLTIRNSEELETAIANIFSSSDTENKNALIQAIKKINELKQELTTTRSMTKKFEIKNNIKAELDKIKGILRTAQTSSSQNPTDPQSTSDTPALSDDEYINYCNTLELDETTKKLIKDMLIDENGETLDTNKKTELMNILKRANEIDTNNRFAAKPKRKEIQKALYKFINENSKVIKKKKEAIKNKAEGIANGLLEEITDTWFDRDKFEDALKKITEDNILEVLDAYEEKSNGENFWKALQGECMTTARKKQYYDYIVDALKKCAKKYGMDIEQQPFAGFIQVYEKEFAKTGLFDGDTEEGKVRFEFEKVLKALRELRAHGQEKKIHW